jgi:hypothetical protein
MRSALGMAGDRGWRPAQGEWSTALTRCTDQSTQMSLLRGF